MWDEVTCPFPKLNGDALEFWEWISNFINTLMDTWLLIHAGNKSNRLRAPWSRSRILAWDMSRVTWLFTNRLFACAFIQRNRDSSSALLALCDEDPPVTGDLRRHETKARRWYLFSMTSYTGETSYIKIDAAPPGWNGRIQTCEIKQGSWITWHYFLKLFHLDANHWVT